MLDKERGLYIAHCEEGALSITGKMANRHGLIAGATGTGKTVTLQVMAETFCQAGVPCFMADMKGDLSGISQPGKMSGFIEKRLPEFFSEELRVKNRLTPHFLSSSRPVQCVSTTCSGNKDTPCVPPSARWGRSCCHVCSV